MSMTYFLYDIVLFFHGVGIHYNLVDANYFYSFQSTDLLFKTSLQHEAQISEIYFWCGSVQYLFVRQSVLKLKI
jgi:hypothetical protein